MAVKMETMESVMGHTSSRPRIPFSSINAVDYMSGLMHDMKFEHQRDGLVLARKLFLDACVEAGPLRDYSKDAAEERKAQSKTYVGQFKADLQNSGLFEDHYRYFRLVGVMRGEALAIGRMLSDDYDVDLRLPPSERIDQELPAAEDRLRYEHIEPTHALIAGSALEALVGTLRLTTPS